MGYAEGLRGILKEHTDSLGVCPSFLNTVLLVLYVSNLDISETRRSLKIEI